MQGESLCEVDLEVADSLNMVGAATYLKVRKLILKKADAEES